MLQARLFPDSAHGRFELVSATAIYFDSLVIPSLPPPVPIFEPGSAFWASMERHGMDMQTGYERSLELRHLNSLLRDLTAEGIVTLTSEPEYRSADGLVDFLNDVLNDEQVSTFIDAAASDAGPFISSSVSFGRPQSDKDKAVRRRFDYAMGAYGAIVSSAAVGYPLVTTSGEDYQAIRRLQARAVRGGSVSIAPAMTELVRLSLPTLVGRGVDDIKAIREHLRDYLGAFRFEMARVAATLPTNDSESDIAEVRRAFERDVQPALEELRRYLSKPSRTLSRYILSDVGTVALSGVSLLGAVTAGAPLETALVGTPLVHLLAAALKARGERLEKMQGNPLTFAVLAEREASKF